MSDPRLDLPPVNAPNFLQRVRESLMTYFGRQGNPLDRGVTLRDLTDADIIDIKAGYTLRNGASSLPLIPGSAIESAYEIDLTAPPAPIGFTASAGIGQITVEHDAPAYTQGHGHSSTTLYGATWVSGPLPTFADAVEIAKFAGNVYSHPTNPSTTWHLWAKWESVDGVLSAPAGGTNGVVATTGADVTDLLDALTGQISESELTTTLSNRIDLVDAGSAVAGSVDYRIAQEAATRAAADATELSARQAAIAQEVIDRNAAIATETAARTTAVADEAAQRLAGIQAEAETRASAIYREQSQRAADDIQQAESILRTAIASHNESTNRQTSTAFVRQVLTEEYQAGDAAEATARLELAAIVASNTAAIVSEQTVRAAADSAMASDITTLFAETADNAAAIISEATARTTADTAITNTVNSLTSTVNNNTAAITAEAITRANADSAMATDITALYAESADNAAAISAEETARTTAVSAEASSRETLATQLRGSYTGSDLASVTAGLIYQERIARANEDNSLAQQITLLSAGSGEQFDWSNIWYFDSGVESWDGNGTPTASAGWLRPANQASGAYVNSATGIAADGNKYSQVRLRIRKTGAPTFAGYLWWRASSDSTWDTARRIALTEPTYDGNGIGLITESPGWTVTVDRIRVDLSSAQTATDYFEIDWVAIGRPSPGASSAQLAAEQTARASADSAETTARETLSSKLTGTTDPSSLTLGTLASGLIYDEKTARTTEDTALAASITTLTATVASNNSTLTSAITSEAAARASADSTETTARQALSSKVTGLADPSSLTLATLASGLLYDEKTARTTEDSALSTSITALTSTVTTNYSTLNAAITTEQTTRANADSSEVTAREALSSKLTGLTDPSAATLASLSSGLLYDERIARTTAVSAVASDVTTLTATVGGLSSDLTTVETAVTDLTTSTAQSVTSLVSADSNLQRQLNESATATLHDIVSLHTERTQRTGTLALARQELTTKIEDGLLAEATARTVLAATVDSNTAAILTEQTTRATADTALSSSITSLTATVNENTAAIATEQTARADADTALTTSVTFLQSQVDGVTASISTESATRAAADTALSTLITSLTATVNGDIADLATEQAARIDADNAIVEDVTILQAQIDSNSAAITSEASVRATQTGDLFAKYTVKVDVNGYVSGFGLASTANNATPTSEFVIRADKFYVASPGGPGIAPIVPFVVNTTTETINGVSVPAGVYMDAAYIKNGTITAAKIGNAVIDSAKIADAAITTTKIADATITTAKLIDASITSAKINDAAITTAKILDASITGAKIADASITTAKIADASITAAKIVDATITTAKIADATITSAKIVSLDAAKITTASLSAINANLGTVTAGKAQNTAGTNFIDFNATGTSSFLKVGLNVDIKADGSGTFARAIVSAPNVVASGTKTISPGPVGGGGSEHGGGADSFTVTIDTGYNIPAGWAASSSSQYVANATISNTGSWSTNGGVNGYAETKIVVGDGLISGSPPSGACIDGRIYIIYTWTWDGAGYGRYINPGSLSWTLSQV